MAQNKPRFANERRDLPPAFIEREGKLTVVWLQGEHDAFTVNELSDTIALAIEADDNDLVIDLSQVQFMDASTVGAIVLALELLRLRSRELSIRKPSRCARRVIDLCGLGDLLLASELASVPRRREGALSSWVEVPASGGTDRPTTPVSDDEMSPTPMTLTGRESP